MIPSRFSDNPALPVVLESGGARCELGASAAYRRDGVARHRDFERFFRHHIDEVRSWVRRDLGPHRTIDVDDVAHEVMMAAYERSFRCAHGESGDNSVPEPWLRAVARNKAVDHLRRTWRDPAPLEDADLHHIPAVDGGLSGEDTVLARELVVFALRRLSLRQREILLRTADGFTVAEIAVMLGYDSQSAVRQQLYRARKLVREQVDNGDD